MRSGERLVGYVYDFEFSILLWVLLILKVKLVCDKDGNPRGYAFIEYENETDMKCMYTLYSLL